MAGLRLLHLRLPKISVIISGLATRALRFILAIVLVVLWILVVKYSVWLRFRQSSKHGNEKSGSSFHAHTPKGNSSSCEIWWPHVVTYIVTCLYVPYLQWKATVKRNHLYNLLYRLRVVACSVTTCLAFLAAKDQSQAGWYHYSTTGSMFCITVWCYLEYYRGSHPSILPTTGLTLLLAPHIALVRVAILQANVPVCPNVCQEASLFLYIPLSSDWLCCYVTCLKATVSFVIITDIFMPSSSFNYRDKIHSTDKPKKQQVVNPYGGTSLFSRITFSWIFSHMKISQTRELNIDDLYVYEDGHNCENSIELLGKIMRRSHNKNKSAVSWTHFYRHRDLVLGLFKIVQWPIISGLIIHIIATGFSSTHVLAVGTLINYLESGSSDVWFGVWLAFRLGFLSIGNNSMNAFYYYNTNYATSRLKGVLSGLVMDKYLKLSPRARATIGNDVLTYLTTDAQTLGNVIADCNFGFELVFAAPICAWIIWSKTDLVSFIVGISVMWLNNYISTAIMRRYMGQLQKKATDKRTERVNLLQSILQGIKVLKLNAWEDSFKDRVNEIRREELACTLKARNMEAFAKTLMGMSPNLVISAMFFVYTFFNKSNIITAEKIFVTMLAAETLTFHFQRFPSFYASYNQAVISSKRLLGYFDMEEKTHMENEPYNNHKDKSALITDGSFSQQEEIPLLKRINLNIAKGELVAIVGPVGSGKSLLLSAVLGEMHTVTGSRSLSGSVALCQQEPWIMNDTIRENILLGQHYDPTRLNDIIDACALKPDIDSFPLGELTEVGERGVTLSGGQRHRLSLARAVYADADIYLLDDTLSAVDTQVAAHLFNRIIGPRGILKHKTRLLVTHALQWLGQVDRVVLMHEGQIKAAGSHSHLRRTQPFLNNHHNTVLRNIKEEPTVNEKKELKNGGFCPMNGSLMTKETSPREKTSLSILYLYHKAFGWYRLLVIIFFMVLMAVLRLENSMWATNWSNEWKNNATVGQLNNNYRQTGFFLLGFSSGVSEMIALVALAAGSLAASSIFHGNLISKVFNAKPSFFDTTPSGRIINWFTRDINDIDVTFAREIIVYLGSLPRIITALILISWKLPVVLLIIIPIIVFFPLLKKPYTPYNKDLMRIDGVNRSFAFSQFTQCMQGIVSIHAYRRSHYIRKCFYQQVDKYCRPYWHIAASTNFLRMTSMNMAAFINFLTAVMCVLYREAIPTGFAAALIFNTAAMSYRLSAMLHRTAEIERLLVAVERVLGTSIKEETSTWSSPVPNSWPKEGRVQFINFTARYRPDLNPVLKDVSFSIRPSEKIGIIGRTGAGKSTLMLSLLRILEPLSGKVMIDDVNVATLSLKQLRSKVTLITQDPVLFSASVRDNLDPFGCYSDARIWEVLEQAHLKPLLIASSKSLDTHCGNNGDNFSVGEKQLLCLARALLRDTKILVLDEPTASVDVHTDSLIQKTLKSCFTNCTIITIAHRLHTIMEYDRILILDEGRITEFDTPVNLLAVAGSHLSTLREQA